jgi:hypothetical protein
MSAEPTTAARALRAAGVAWRTLEHAKLAVFVALGAIALGFAVYWTASPSGATRPEAPLPDALELAVGFVTNFFDTLGIGSFAPTTSSSS